MADSNLQVGSIGDGFRSVYDFAFKPNIYKNWIYKYGKGFYLKHMLDMINEETYTRDDRIILFSKGAIEKPITLSTAIAAGAAGDPITIILDSGDYVGSNPLLRVGDTVVIPAAYQPAAVGEPRVYVVTAKDATAAPNTEFTAEPLNADGTTYTASQIAVEIPIGTKLQVGGTRKARGANPLDPKVTGYYQQTYYSNILSEHFKMEGGLNAFDTYAVDTINGPKSLYIEGQEEAEIRLDMQMDQVIWQSEENDNTALANTISGESGTNAVKSGVGYRNWLKRLASSLGYDAPFDFSDLDRVKDLHIAEGVVDTDVMFCVEPTLGTDLDNAGLDHIKSFSAGTDLFKNGMDLGAEFATFMKNGRKYILKELQGLANPQSYANSGYVGEGFMFPLSSARVTSPSGKEKDVPMLSLLYLGGKGTDRKRIVEFHGGNTGSNLGRVTQRGDVDYLDFGTEFILVAVNVNQHVHVTRN